MTKSAYTVFNSVVSDMLGDMAERFPANKQLASSLAFHQMACKANIRIPYERFVEYAVKPYGDRLLAHDDSFFMEQSFGEFGEEGTGFIEALKRLWAQMTPEDRQSVHDYLDLLLSVHGRLSGASDE